MSGEIDYDVRKIRLHCVEIAFEITQKIGSQSMAFDFVLTLNGTPMVVEVSYCYDPTAVYRCEGHWGRQLNWHDGHMWPEEAILVDLLKTISQRRSHRSLAAVAN